MREFHDEHVDQALDNNASLAHSGHLNTDSLFQTITPAQTQLETSVAIPASVVESIKAVAAVEELAAQDNTVRSIQSDPEHKPGPQETEALAAVKEGSALKARSAQEADTAFDDEAAPAPQTPDNRANLPVLSAAQKALLEAAARGARLEPASHITTAAAPVAAVEPVASAPNIPTSDSQTAVPEPARAADSVAFPVALQKAASRGDRQGMVRLMQSRFGLSLETCHQIFEDRDGDTFSVLLKSDGVDSASANRILLLVFPAIGLSVHNAARSIRYYSQLEKSACKDAVAQWPKAVGTDAPAAKSAHHAPYLSDTDRQHVRSGPGASTTMTEPAHTSLRQTG